ncbi:MAG: cyclophilin-like fold protein [Dehalococcoidia bacterium]
MPHTILITAGPVRAEAQLNDSSVAESVFQALPISASANTWGDEIYFGIPLDAEVTDGQEVVELGDLGYWSPGHAFCIFFGPTPASRGDEIRAASAVAVIGKVAGDPTIFKQVPSGTPISIEAAED